MTIELNQRIQDATTIFTPRQAIKTPEHLAGRTTEINRVMTAIIQPGAHAIVYGDRGVGKTSLANCVAEFISRDSRDPLIIGPVNCDSGDTYNTIWRKVFVPITLTEKREMMGLAKVVEETPTPLLDHLPEPLTPFDVQGALEHLATNGGVVVMLDEFDRLREGETTRLMTDTIKGLSDQDVAATLILIGVAESVTDLIRSHESIARHLVEVHMPRLSSEERLLILTGRLAKIGLHADNEVLEIISTMSRGLPYYIHLLGQKAALAAIWDESDSMTAQHLRTAIDAAVAESDRALRDAYYEATRTTHKSKYAETLAACSLAKCDDFGYFTTKDVGPVLSRILGEDRTPGSFMERLEKMSSPERGSILVSEGRKYDRRFRFRDPLVQPFVVMKSLESGIISMDVLVG